MATIELTEARFTEVINQSGIVLVDWWASWCGPCRAFAPVFESVATAHADVLFAKVNTEAAPALANGLGVRAIPTLMVFRDGILLYEQAGALPAAALEQLIGKVRALDMDKIRDEVAAQAGA